MPYGYTNDQWLAMSSGQRARAANNYNMRTYENHETKGKAIGIEFHEAYNKFEYDDGTTVTISLRK